jgi:hypothetical protein
MSEGAENSRVRRRGSRKQLDGISARLARRHVDQLRGAVGTEEMRDVEQLAFERLTAKRGSQLRGIGVGERPGLIGELVNPLADAVVACAAGLSWIPSLRTSAAIRS